MTTVAVGDELDEKWATLVVDGPLARVCSSLASRYDVHAVHLDTRDLVSALEVLRVHRAALRARAHTVLVVLAYEDTREVPELGHVERLEDLTLVAGTVTVKREGAVVLLAVLKGESKTGANGDLGTDDTVAAEESGSEDVHGTALAVRRAALTTEELAEDTNNGTTAKDGEGMAAVAGDDEVILMDAVLQAD